VPASIVRTVSIPIGRFHCRLEIDTFFNPPP
jgi:hypothetical protein